MSLPTSAETSSALRAPSSEGKAFSSAVGEGLAPPADTQQSKKQNGKGKPFPQTVDKVSSGFSTQDEKKSNPFLRQLCRLKNTLRRALRALAPTKTALAVAISASKMLVDKVLLTLSTICGKGKPFPYGAAIIGRFPVSAVWSDAHIAPRISKSALKGKVRPAAGIFENSLISPH